MLDDIKKHIVHLRKLQSEMQGYKCCQDAAQGTCDSILEFIAGIEQEHTTLEKRLEIVEQWIDRRESYESEQRERS